MHHRYKSWMGKEKMMKITDRIKKLFSRNEITIKRCKFGAIDIKQTNISSDGKCVHKNVIKVKGETDDQGK